MFEKKVFSCQLEGLRREGTGRRQWARLLCLLLLLWLWIGGTVAARDLAEIREQGVLRHLGVPCAHFVTGSGDGLDVEVMKMFAATLGVRYEYVATTWGEVVQDLTGKQVKVVNGRAVVVGSAVIRGDVAANGMTVLPWRQQVVAFSLPMFPTQVWLVARADSQVRPIKPSGDLARDIAETRKLLAGRRVLGKQNTCLDPSLYDVAAAGGVPVLFAGALNELAPAVINGLAELTILDVPDALIAMEKWPGKLKVVGPVSPPQLMAAAFAPESRELREMFNEFFARIWRDRTYQELVRKYYPEVFQYYPEFFRKEVPAAP